MRTALHRLSAFVLIATVALCFTACQSSTLEREAGRAQGTLAEADLLMELRRFDEAEARGYEALDKVAVILEQAPENIDYRLLRVRALMTIFMAKNVVIIEQAPVRKGSLVRIPARSEYREYDDLVGPSEAELKDIANNIDDLSWEQSGYVHGMLAAILRLTPETAEDADREYVLALDAYEAWLTDLKDNRPIVGSNNFQIGRLENQIRGLLLARAEVNFLTEDWSVALEMLEEVMAGPDLKYFEVQFPFLEKQVEDIQKKLEDDERITLDPRVRRLNEAIARTRKGSMSAREERAAMDPYKAQLLHIKIELADTKNNLLYRIICYQRLGRQQEYDEARLILRTYYPELDATVDEYLNS